MHIVSMQTSLLTASHVAQPLQEPTSGLDSSIAFKLLQLLQLYAKKAQKTLLLTIHQPSTQMFYMFDHLLLLYQGQVSLRDLTLVFNYWNILYQLLIITVTFD